MDDWYLNHLACPKDHLALKQMGNKLVCSHGHSYPVVDGIPVMLLDNEPHTIDVARDSLSRASGSGALDERAPDFYLESLSISEDEKKGILDLLANQESKQGIDPVVAYLVAATNGLAYKHLIGKVTEYPIPHLHLPEGNGRTFLDIGCSWGRWCIAARQKGYQAVGLDPSLGAVMAARRVSRQMGLDIRFVVGDARHLPFADREFDTVFSYSVLQHLSKKDAESSFMEIGRALAPGGVSFIQLPTTLGVRCLYHQLRRGFREARGFEVRYWGVPGIKNLFSKLIGKTSVSVDCFFGIGLQHSDVKYMTPKLKFIVAFSERLKKVSQWFHPLIYVADSVYVKSFKAVEDGNAPHGASTDRGAS